MLMEIDEYEAKMDVHRDASDDPRYHRMYAAIGLAGEVGEVVELVKKAARRSHAIPTDPAKLALELGDSFWYLARTAALHGLSMRQVLFLSYVKNKMREHSGKNPEAELDFARRQLAVPGNVPPDGLEAEELRDGIQRIIDEEDDLEEYDSALQNLLDEVDARDSLHAARRRDRAPMKDIYGAQRPAVGPTEDGSIYTPPCDKVSFAIGDDDLAFAEKTRCAWCLTTGCAKLDDAGFCSDYCRREASGKGVCN